jgi:hypothetical protein
LLGSGQSGSVFKFGKNGKRAIKLSPKAELDTYSTINKSINGVVKVYSYGKIKVPTRFLLKRFGGKVSDIIETRGSYISLNKDGYIYYIIMERLYTDKALEDDIEDLQDLFEQFYEVVHSSFIEIPGLRKLFEERDNMEILLKFSNYIEENVSNSESVLETLANCLVLFRKIGKNFDWMDIHARQFAYDSRGNIKAYDLDNSYMLSSDEVKNIIREGYSSSKSKLSLEFIDLARDNYETFLDRTYFDNTFHNVLYRGYFGDLGDNIFMTDDLDHARHYGEEIDGIVYFDNILHFDNALFDELRLDLPELLEIDISKDSELDYDQSIFKEKLREIYLPYFNGNKLTDAMYQLNIDEDGVIDYVYDMINSTKKYRLVSMSKSNDFLIPLLMYYAKEYNIISFWGSDYGGSLEFVVGDISRYDHLSDIWKKYGKD